MRQTQFDREIVAEQIGLKNRVSIWKASYFGCFSLAVMGMFWSERGYDKPLRVLPPAVHQVGAKQSADSKPIFEQHFFEPIPTAPSVHASTITCLGDGGMMAAWFGGTREGAKDVSIYGSTWNSSTRSWGTPSVIVDADVARRELGRYVKKLGNPVLYCDQSGRIWLYFVKVSVGGWSGSSVSWKYSDDGGVTWSESQRFISSPFLNISNLVRSVPLEMSDGSLLLPVYHEFLTKYGEILHLSPDGELIAKYRMGNSVGALQPTLVSVDDQTILAFHRRTGDIAPRVYTNRSGDGGRTWSDIRPTDLQNPNASVAVVRRNNGGFLMALNASETERLQLSLAISDDGNDWRIVKTFPAIANGLESSYPTLIKSVDGNYHLTYTWGREKICHILFNDSWLEQSP